MFRNVVPLSISDLIKSLFMTVFDNDSNEVFKPCNFPSIDSRYKEYSLIALPDEFIESLRILHLESRLLDENNADSFDAQAPIDWDKVNSIIDAEREKSLLLLYSELKK